MGENVRSSNGVPFGGLISGCHGREATIVDAEKFRPRGGEVGGSILGATVAAWAKNDAGSGSTDRRHQTGGVRGGRTVTPQVICKIHGGEPGFCLGTASDVSQDERSGLDALGLSAHGSSFSAVRGLSSTGSVFNHRERRGQREE